MVNIVLFQPEIPQNTGNIMRTCMAANAHLILVEPLGFSLDEKSLKRAGMDYIDKISYEVVTNLPELINNRKGHYYFITRYGNESYTEFEYPLDEDIYLVFGRESTGIDKEILLAHKEKLMRIPMVADARSLNLSNSVAIVLYECLRQQGFPMLSKTEVLKGANFLESE